MKYRPEIDGLRAIALLPVIFFHAGFPGFDGGYVGVDVFFVISGFLITTIIVREKNAGRFSIADFYDRRARRILPALFFVMLACIGPAWAWMFPYQLEEFSRALIATSVFAANLLFARDSVQLLSRDYFAATVEDNPLLHMWSLAVEEQYYLVFPLFLAAFWWLGRRRLGWLILAVALGSLALGEWGWRHHASANFFLPQYRVWELLIGALLAFLAFERPLHERVSRGVNEGLAFVGLLFIAYSVVFFDEKTPFPSLWALLPTVGSALVIGFGTPKTIVGRALSVRPLVGIGLISYSAYLWHQPLFAFTRVYHHSVPSDSTLLALSGVSLGLAYVSWRWVEQPFRDKSRFTRRQIFGMSGLGIAFFVAVGLVGVETRGGQNRYDDEQLQMLAYSEHRQYLELYLEGRCFLTPESGVTEFDDSCFDALAQPNATLVWGDSHAASLAVGLRAADSAATTSLNTSSCPPLVDLPILEDQCKWANRRVLELLSEHPATTVVLHADWETYEDVDGFDQALVSTLDALRERGVRSVIVGTLPRWELPVPELLAASMFRSERSLAQMERRLDVPRIDRLRSTDRRLQALADEHGVTVISILDTVCEERSCTALVSPGDGAIVPVAWDYGHLTEVGSSHVVERTGLLRQLGGRAPRAID